MELLVAADTNARHPTSTTAFCRILLAPFCILLSAALSACGQTEANLPVRVPVGKLPVYQLKITAKALAALDANPDSDETQPATLVADGVTYQKVQVRYRGDWARSWPKKPLKIFFSDNQRFGGHRSLNLNSAWRDPAFVRESLAYHIYAACGVPASQSRLVRLELNGEFRGVYVEVEQVDKTFLRRVGLKGATIYKTASPANQADERDLGRLANYAQHYEQETQEDTGYRELQKFCRELSRTTNALEFFTANVDLDRYINYLAATALVQNWDCFNKNHFLVYDGEGSKKWLVIPWDLDRTLGDHWAIGSIVAEVPILQGTQSLPGPTGWNRMMQKFFSDPVLKERFAKRLEELLKTEFTTEKLFPVLEQFEKAIAADAARDRQRWRGTAVTPQKGIAQLKNYIERRRNFLLKDVKNLRAERS